MYVYRIRIRLLYFTRKRGWGNRGLDWQQWIPECVFVRKCLFFSLLDHVEEKQSTPYHCSNISPNQKTETFNHEMMTFFPSALSTRFFTSGRFHNESLFGSFNAILGFKNHTTKLKFWNEIYRKVKDIIQP